MGNFHCITTTCAKVRYQPYNPKKVRYQYPNEAAQEAEADDFEIISPVGQCPIQYRCQFNIVYSNGFTQSFFRVFYGRIGEYEIESTSRDNKLYLWTGVQGNDEPNNRQFIVRSGGGWLTFTSVELTITPNDPNQLDNCADCTFKLFRNEQLIYQEIREDCPIAEILPCELGDIVNEVQISKRPWLEKVQVVDNYSTLINELISNNIENIEAFFFGEIPENCIEVWHTPIADLPDLTASNLNNTLFGEYYRFIGQYCSPNGCPPPEYEVICDDSCGENCRSCPEGTCAVECGIDICCYNSAGEAVESIAINDYCEV